MVNIVFLYLVYGRWGKAPFKPCTNITRIFFNRKSNIEIISLIKAKMSYNMFFRPYL